MLFARLKHQANFALVSTLAVLIASASPASAAPGDLDPTFDGDGRVTTDFAGSDELAEAVAIQGDGKIVAAGFADIPGRDFGLARYNTAGSLDPTFGGDGTVTTDFAGDNDQAFGVAIRGDGKIVAAGVAVVGNGDFALARYNADGSLDPTFSGDGKVTTGFATGSGDVAFGVAIQGDGKIVTAGSSQVPTGFQDFALARYNADGSLDPTFGVGGTVTTDFASDLDIARAVAIQGDGKIVAAGIAFVSGADFALARYDSDGSLDLTFDGDGKVTTNFAGSFDEASAVAIQGNGKIVAAGYALGSGPADFALARYNADGSLDPTFSGDGLVTTDFAGDSDLAFGVAIQANGKIVAAGSAVVGFEDFALARYNPDGSLDPTFSGDGKVTTDFTGSVDEAFAVAIQADGKIVAAGRALVSENTDFALARYTVCRRTSRPSSIPFCP